MKYDEQVWNDYQARLTSKKVSKQTNNQSKNTQESSNENEDRMDLDDEHLYKLTTMTIKMKTTMETL